MRPDDPTLWYLTRGAAATAYLLLALVVALGVALSVRAFEGVLRAWRVADLHQFLTLAASAFVALHLGALLFDPFKPFTPSQLVWPLAETYRPLPVALGVLTLYLLLAVVVSSLIRRTIGARVWRGIHLLSYLAFALVTLHGILTGTDTTTPWMLGLYFGAGGMTLWLTGARIYLALAASPAPSAASSKRIPSQSVPPYK